MVPSQLFIHTNTTELSFEQQVYVERRLLEIGEESNDPIVYIRTIHEYKDPIDMIVGKIYFALQSRLKAL